MTTLSVESIFYIFFTWSIIRSFKLFTIYNFFLPSNICIFK